MVFCLLYIVCPSVLSCTGGSNLKLHQTLGTKSIFIQENVMLQLTFNPGLTLTSFRTTRPRLKIFTVFAMTSYQTDDNRNDLCFWVKLLITNHCLAFLVCGKLHIPQHVSSTSSFPTGFDAFTLQCFFSSND